MKKVALLSLFALLLVATFANAQCGPGCVFYGGDLNVNSPNADGLANENDAIVGGTPYGAATYQNFTLGADATVTSVFSNNLSGLTPWTAYWEIRTGVSEGNGGTLVAAGTGGVTQTATGRSAFGYNEYRDALDGLDLVLTAWHAVLVCGGSERSEQCKPLLQQQQHRWHQRGWHPEQQSAVLQQPSSSARTSLTRTTKVLFRFSRRASLAFQLRNRPASSCWVAG